MSSAITIRPVTTKSELHQFIHLPEYIHRHHANWLPPIFSEEREFYNPAKNRAFKLSDTILLLAYRDQKAVGRVMGIINPLFNEKMKMKQARFFNLECVDDPEVCKMLLMEVENWALQKGMSEVIGPFGFSDKDPQGLQVEGFQHPAVIATATNSPYLPPLVEQCGFVKMKDCVVYRMNIPDPIPEVYSGIYERTKKNPNFQLIEFKRKSELKPFVIPVLRAVNDIYDSIFGFMPLEESEMKMLAKKYLPILDPEFTKVVVDRSGCPVAFLVATPDISKGIIKARGRLFPFGFIHILNASKHTEQLDFFLGGVRKEFRNTGITSLLGYSLFRSAQRRGLKYIDTHLILDDNMPMRSMIERWDSRVYKRYRIYSKKLN